MPCNGHGHSPNCDCGWGGVNHNPWQPNIRPDWSSKDSHTIPNARCPQCRNQVFFYRSPEGGTVFFDSLGPPWPKHPCTDKTLNVKLPNKPEIKQKSTRKKKLKRWWPYPCGKVESLPNKEGVCLYGEDGKRLFIKTRPENIPPHTPIWIRQLEGVVGFYDVATFKLKQGRPINVGYIGYSEKGVLLPEG